MTEKYDRAAASPPAGVYLPFPKELKSADTIALEDRKMPRTVPGRPRADFWIALALLLASIVCGCGGDNDDDLVRVDGNPTGPSLTYVGRYLGASNLVAGQFAVLDLTTTTAGTASGTLQVAVPTVPVANLQAAGGQSIAATGTVNLDNGNFNLSGALEGLGPFSVDGNLPAGNDLGSFLITIGGQTFNGVIQNADLGTPNPPGGGGGSGSGTTIIGGALSSLVFSASSDYNGFNPPVTSNSTIAGALLESSGGESAIGISITETTSTGVLAKVRTLSFGVALAPGETLVVGRSYPLANRGDFLGAYMNLSESTGPTGGGPGPLPLQSAPISIDRSWAPTASTTGSVTVTRLTSSAIELDFSFANVGPNSDSPGNSATGSFSISGHVLGNFDPAGQ